MSSEDRELKLKNDEIENQLRQDKMTQQNEIKMLLLGTLDHPLIGFKGPESLESRQF